MTCDLRKIDPGVAACLPDLYRAAMAAMAADPARPWRADPLLSEEDRRTALAAGIGTTGGYPSEASLHGLVEEQAGRTPGATAVADADRQMTYAELNGRANQVARSCSPGAAWRPTTAWGRSLAPLPSAGNGPAARTQPR